MAKPNKKAPEKSIDIFCTKCNARLYQYKKGGKGALVKCFKARISKDFTLTECTCPQCNTVFARQALIRGMPALKMIGTKVWFK